MMVKDLVFEKEISLLSEDPYGKAFGIKNDFALLFVVNERKNEIWTDGPHHRNVLEFDAIESIDHYSHIILKVRMEGSKDAKTLNVNTAIEIITNIKEGGFFSSAYAEYYMKTAYPAVSSACRKRAHDMQKEIESLFKKELVGIKR